MKYNKISFLKGYIAKAFYTVLVVVFFVGCGSELIVPDEDPTDSKDTISNGDTIEQVDTIIDVVDSTDLVDTTGTVTDTTTVNTDTLTVDDSKIYIPRDLRNNNFYKKESQWSYYRSKQSEHFIVFWEKKYGDNDPNSFQVPSTYRVDIDDLLEKAEYFFDVNVNQLKFANVGTGESRLDDYKMMIFIFYQSEWLATGAGYDDVIGALWVSPSTCKPVGHTIAHEIGHSFQYQVFSDLGGGSGFRYGFGGNGGNGFWEQCAQWQGFQCYPEEVFSNYHFGVYTENAFRHICHEWYRYASYWIHYYWADKHGEDIVGRIWREAQKPEDPLEAYMRITGFSVDELNDEIFEASTRFVTWDIDAIRDLGSNYIGAQSFKSTKLDDGSYMPTYDRCIGTTGYNVIPLNVPEAGTIVSTEFTGMVNADGYNQVADASRAGWRYGYVALQNNGNRVYSEMFEGTSNEVEFTVPDNCKNLWFVVTGAPDTYKPHAWDEDESNDDQWPYKVKFSNTNLFGEIDLNGEEDPQSVTFTYDVGFPYSNDTYVGANVSMGSDLNDLAQAFVLQPSDITAQMGSKIKFYAVESDGSLNATTTANGYGHWFDAGGNVIGWGNDAKVFSEFDASSFSFSIGQYPDHSKAGDTYTVSQALVYEYESGKTVQATFVFNITIQ